MVFDSRDGGIQPLYFSEGKADARGREETCPRSLRQTVTRGSEPSLQGPQSRVLSSVQTHLPHLIGQPPPDEPRVTGCQGRLPGQVWWTGGIPAPPSLQTNENMSVQKLALPR